jgi:chromosome segregation ATPase
MRAAADAASDRFDRLDAAMQLDTSNMDLAKSRVEALVTAMSTNSNEMDALKAAMGSIPSDKLDMAAIASGDVAANMADAKSRFDEAQRAVDSYEVKIKQLTDELGKMEEKEGKQILSDDEVAKMGELRERIGTLKPEVMARVSEAVKISLGFPTGAN